MAELNDHSSRAHALLSASSADRWLNCPPSAVAAEAYRNEGTEFTREGTIAHEVAERVAQCAVDGIKYDWDRCEDWSSEDVTAEMIECAKGYADYILEQIHEDNALVMLEQRVDFSPWVPGGFGTGDCIIIQSKVMDVIDYKFGKGVAVSAVDNPQEKCYGLGALNDFGFAYEIEKVRLHIYQPRINNISVFEISADDLLAWGEDVVKPTAEQAAKGKGKYSAGAWCKFCPHAGRCRTLTKICSEYVNTHGLKVRVPVLAPHEVAEVLAMEPLVTLWLKRVKDQALSSMLSGEQVPGYKVVAGKPGNRKWADDLETAKLLQEAGYTQEEITTTELLSVAKMEKAIGKKKVAELVGGQILQPPGAPTIALESDKRPTYNPADDFDALG
jgi:hypothetical protein